MPLVKFTPLSVAGANFSQAYKAQFLTIGQVFKWEFSDASGAYSGLMAIGEQPTAQGFQTVANMSVSVSEKTVSPEKLQELSRIVNTEFQQE